MKKIVNGILLSAAVMSGTLQAEAKKLQRPNVLFILADDYGWMDLGCMGSKYYETPNLDRLASSGIRFTNAYASCQVSSPSRASIMTGRYTPRHGVTDWIGAKSGEDWRSKKHYSKLLPADYVWNLPAEEYTIAECLRDNGYTTFIAGKWHLGDEGSWPEDHGFMINKGGWSAGSPTGGYFSPYKNPKLEDGPKGENLSVRLGQETVNFMREHKEKHSDKPFFAYLSFYAVHGPLQTSQKNWAYFRDKAEKMGISEKGFEVDRTLPVRQTQDNPVYAGVIKEMDDAIGIVLDELKRLGIDDNTLVIFTSDNGGVTSGDSYSSSQLPLRGGKGRQWEGGIRVPALMYYSGCKAGTVCDVPVIGTDFYPTILDYAGLKMQPQQHKDGISIMPVVEDNYSPERSLFWHYPHYGNQGGEPSSIIRKGDWKLIYYYESNHCELYNLAMDLTESEPLNAQYPDKVNELESELMAWLDEVDARKPVADPLYDPKKEAQAKKNWRTKTLEQQEKMRKNMLRKDWKPNDDWWESAFMND